MSKPNKYSLYELAVQSPEHHIEMLVAMYRELRGKYAHRLREDFCGTFRLACEWVKRNRNNTAIALDLDEDPIRYGKSHHLKALTAAQKKRLTIMRQNVLTVTHDPSDLVIACNFSFYIFHDRRTLVNYFKYVHKSLADKGLFFLEVAGGPGMIEESKDVRPVFDKGKRKFTYIWDQKSFDPVHSRGKYAIHFRLPNGKLLENAFEYDWRLWSIPEIREAMTDAGFSDTTVYWETEHKGQPTGEYMRSDMGDNAWSWIAYVIGMKG